ncbi:MAG: putative rane protein [Deltaproteobacteria bacterium]|nr:putative rane protein [Deltaproteobacteria bacterium]
MTGVTVGAWLEAFVLTYVIEAAIALPMLRAADPSLARRAALCWFAQLVTHPAVWFIIPRLGLSDPVTVVVAEIWALVLEGVFYALVFPSAGLRRAILVSIAANAASFSVGMALRAFHVM